MGRIRTMAVKRVVKQLIKEYKDKFNTNFEDNKKKVSELLIIPSKKLKNVIAGFLTSQIKQSKDAVISLKSQL